MKRTAAKQLLRYFFILILLIAALYLKKDYFWSEPASGAISVETAHSRQQSEVQVVGSGRIAVLLADDTKGTRHQKFIVRVNESLTVLISHNIDLAPRINDLRKGEHIEFSGEYIYNTKGGLVHWTHHDPNNRHAGGWLQYQGRTYQ